MRLGICGYAETGKDEVADVLVEHFGFVKIGMSDALDKYLQILNPIINWRSVDSRLVPIRYAELREEVGYVEAKENVEVRELLQRLGTDVGRAIDPDIWIKELNKEASKYENVVTTGIRFDNEVDPLDKLLWVDRLGYGPKNDHPSEQLDNIFARAQWKIMNDGTLDDLRAYTFSKFLHMGFKVQ